ncbi:hypothetical protein WEI85_38120 [Actinomycetes bacterium KLBMP 9797]
MKAATVVRGNQDTGVCAESDGLKCQRPHDGAAESAAPVGGRGLGLVGNPERVGGREFAGRGDLSLRVEDDCVDDLAGGVKLRLRDVQIAARHADPRTTMRYDRARKMKGGAADGSCS